MPPKPTTPSVFPAVSRPLDSAGRGHSPFATAADDAYAPRSRNMAEPITYSATAKRIGARGRNDFDPPLAAGIDVDVVEADAEPADDLQRRGGRQQPAIDLRAVAHDERIGARERFPERRGLIDERLVVTRVVLRGEARDRAFVHEFADDDAHALSSHQLCIPQRRTVRASTVRKMTFSTTSPIRITVKRPANTAGISS